MQPRLMRTRFPPRRMRRLSKSTSRPRRMFPRPRRQRLPFELQQLQVVASEVIIGVELGRELHRPDHRDGQCQAQDDDGANDCMAYRQRLRRQSQIIKGEQELPLA